MSSIGIIANPASGKDIRRLVSYATTIDNNEKVNIVKRIVLAAQTMGIDEILFMPDTFNIGYSAIEGLKDMLTIKCRILDIPIKASMEDTKDAAICMEKLGVGCIVVLGGDGTSRAVAKGVCSVPIIPVSTGTNNVYPIMVEGTVVGMAAAVIATISDFKTCCIQDKRIEVFKNDTFADIALIDAVVTEDLYPGTKAIWDISRIKHIVVSRCHPATIGFSAIAGCIQIIKATCDKGLALSLFKKEQKSGHRTIIAPIAAGVISTVNISNVEEIPLDTKYSIIADENCMLALDGEREVKVRKNDRLDFIIKRNGPWRVNIKACLEKACSLGIFERT